MAPYIRAATNGNQERQQTLLVDGLSYSASTYWAVTLENDQTGQIFNLNHGGGGGSGVFRSATATFTGLSPGTRYTYTGKIRHQSSSPITTVTNTLTTPGSAPVPGIPSVSVDSVSGREITWRITAGSNTAKIQISRDWSTSSSTNLSSGSTYYYAQTVPAYDTYYGIRVRGANSADVYGGWSSYSYTWSGTDPTPERVTGLQSNNVSSSGFNISWNSASRATSYQIQYRVRGTSSWSNAYTSSTSYAFTNFPELTYYEVQVRGYSGNNYGSYSAILTVRTESAKPTPLNWRVYRSGTDITNLTASHWNTMTSKVNAWLEYKNLTRTSFTNAVSGRPLTADMYNQAVRALRRLHPNRTIETVVRGQHVTASRINLLGDLVDSIL